jgi:alkanesulfonate monooxygenase
VVCGHTPHELRYYGDCLPHDARYARTDEFLSICRAYWRRDAEVNFHGTYYTIERGRLHTPFVSPERTAPEIYVGGNSAQAAALAVRHAACLWRLAEPPEALRPHIRPLVQSGTEVGLLVSLLARPTRAEAVRDACL